MAEPSEISNLESAPDSEFLVNVVLPGGQGQCEVKSVHIMDQHGTDLTVAQIKASILAEHGIVNPGDYAALFVNSTERRPITDGDLMTNYIQYLASGYQLEFQERLYQAKN